MTWSVPGVVISRDGTVRVLIPNRSKCGAVLGQVELQGKEWLSECSNCYTTFTAPLQRRAVLSLRNHCRDIHDQH